MQQSADAMQVALRVLTAITNREQPDADDVRELLTHAHPTPYGSYSPDELDQLACDVIQAALKHQKAVRSKKAAKG